MSKSGQDEKVSLGLEDDIHVSKLVWWGRVEPKLFNTPSSVKTVTIGFLLFWYLFIAFVAYQPGRAVEHLPDSIHTIIVTNCYVEMSCSTREYQTFTATVERGNHTLTIDGSDTRRCNYFLCMPTGSDGQGRTQDLNIVTEGSVVNLAALTGSLGYGIAVTDRSGSDGLPSKLIIQNVSLTSLEVNLTSALVLLQDVRVSEQATIVNNYGPVFLNSHFGYPFNINATVEDGAYCVSNNTVVDAPACSLPGNNCSVHISYAGGLGIPSNYVVRASSVYVDEMNANVSTSAFSFVSEGSRVAGPAMSAPPALSPAVQDYLNNTAAWAAASPISDYVQAVEVITPSLGVMFLNGKNKITLEIRPEYLAFFSGYALQVNYRRLVTPLNHYRCEQSIGRVLLAASSLSSVLVNNEYDFESEDGWLQSDYAQMVETHYSLDDQASTAREIYTAVQHTGVVTFTSPEKEWSGHSNYAGQHWESHVLETDARGKVVTKPLTMSSLAYVLVWLSIFTSLFMMVGCLIVIFKNRVPILSSLLLINERDLLRNMVGYRRNAPYHYFFSVIQVSAWIVFRMTKLLSESMVYPTRKSPFGRFLGYYFSNPKKDSSEDRIDGAKLRTMAVDTIYEQYQRWAVMRFFNNEISNGEMAKAFDEFGSRRYDEPKLVVHGLRLRKDIDPKAKFSLQFSQLQNFYLVTYINSDTVLFDDIYNRALAAQSNIENEQDLVRKLRQWRFEVVSKNHEVAYNIMPTSQAALSEEKLSPYVHSLEEMCFSYPSYATVELTTTGTSGILRRLMWLTWILLESALIFVATILPLALSFLVTIPLEFEHSRFSTSSSTLKSSDLGSVVSHLGAPKPSSLPSMVIYVAFVIFVGVLCLEPWLVWITYRWVGNASHNKMGVFHPAKVLLYFRVLLGGIAMLLNALATMFVWCYAFNLLIWWILGAVIEPNQMLVYASSVITTLYIIGTVINNLDSMRKQALERLKVRILEEMLNMVRKSPAANLFDRFKTERVAVDTGDGVMVRVKSQAPTVTSGIILDAVSDDRARQTKAVDMIANSVECPHGILWLGLAVVKRDEKMIKVAVHEMLELMDIPLQFEPLALQLVNQIINLPVSALQLSHSMYTLVPTFEAKLLEYDDIIIPLVQCALKKTFTDKVLIDSLRRVVHEELADHMQLDPMLLRRGFSLGWALKKGDRPQAYKDAAGILTDLLPQVPEKPKSLRSLYLCAVEGMKLATNQPHRFVDSVSNVIRRLDLEKTELFAAMLPLIQASDRSGRKGPSMVEDFDFDRVSADIAAAVEAEFPMTDEVVVMEPTENDVTSQATAAGTVVGGNRVTSIKRLATMLMQRFASTVAIRFALAPQQLNQLAGLFDCVCGERSALDHLPADLQVRTPLVNVLSHAISALDKREGIRQQNFFSDEEDIAKLQESARKNPHEQLELWLADQWCALLDVFAFRKIRPGICDCSILARICGVPAEALQLVRQLCIMVQAMVKFLFPEAERFQELGGGAKVEAQFISDSKIMKDDVFLLIKELTNVLVGEFIQPAGDLALDKHFVDTIRKRVSGALINKVADFTNTDALLAKVKQLELGRTGKYLAALEDDDDDEEMKHLDEFGLGLLQKSMAIFLEHTVAEGSPLDVANKVKKLAIHLTAHSKVPYDDIPYVKEAPDRDVLFDDLVDLFTTPYGVGEGEGLDMDFVESLGMEPNVLRLLAAPNSLLRATPGLEILPFLMTILHDVELNKAGATEAILQQLLHDLGINNDEIPYAKLQMLFFSKRGVSLIDEEDEHLARQMRFLKDAYLKSIENRHDNFHRSMITLMYDKLTDPKEKEEGHLELSLPVVVEACSHYKRLKNFLDWKLFPIDPTDAIKWDKLRDARTTASESDARCHGADFKTHFELTVAEEVLKVVEFFCPHLNKMFQEREHAHYEAMKELTGQSAVTLLAVTRFKAGLNKRGDENPEGVDADAVEKELPARRSGQAWTDESSAEAQVPDANPLETPTPPVTPHDDEEDHHDDDEGRDHHEHAEEGEDPHNDGSTEASGSKKKGLKGSKKSHEQKAAKKEQRKEEHAKKKEEKAALGEHSPEGSPKETHSTEKKKGAAKKPEKKEKVPPPPKDDKKDEKRQRAAVAATSGIKDHEKLLRLRELIDEICEDNPVVLLYIDKVEGDDDDEVSVDAGDLPVEVMDCFQSMSPFELMGPDVRQEIREVFGVMSGFSNWFPSEYPSKFYAACTAAALGPLTNVATLQVLASVVPLKYQNLAVELLRLACGDRTAPMLAIATFLNEPVGDVEEARDLYFPPSVQEWYEASKEWEKNGGGNLLSGQEKNPVLHYQWITLIKAAIRGDPFAFLLLPELKAQTKMIRFGFLTATGSYRDIIIDLFEDIDAGPLLEGEDEEDAGAFEKMFPVLSKKMDTLFLLEDEEDMWMDSQELAESKQMRKSIELFLGLVYVSRSEFDAAEKRFLVFTGSDEIMTPMVDLLLLAARLIVEDGAVSDSHAIIGAVESVARMGIVFYKANPLPSETLEKYPKIQPFLTDVLPFIADAALDIFNEYEEGVEDELDPFEEAEAVKNAAKENAATFAAEALANVNDLENLDWLTEEFENLRTIVESLYEELDEKMDDENELYNGDEETGILGEVTLFKNPLPGYDADRIRQVHMKLNDLVAKQRHLEDLILIQSESDDDENVDALESMSGNSGQSGHSRLRISPSTTYLSAGGDNKAAEDYNINDLYLDLEDMLNELASFEKSTIPYAAKLVSTIETSARDIHKRLIKSPQMEALNKIELSLELTPELLGTVISDLDSVKAFVSPADLPVFNKCETAISRIAPELKSYVVTVEEAMADEETPENPTPEQIVQFDELHVSMGEVMSILCRSTEHHGQDSKFKALKRDLKKTKETFTQNVDLFAAAVVVFPVVESLVRMRSLLEQLDNFLTETLGELGKYLKGKDGSGLRDFLANMITLLGSENLSQAKVDSSLQLMQLFIKAVERILESPALETVIEEAVEIFTLVQETRARHLAEERTAAGLPPLQDQESEVLIGAAQKASKAILEVLASMDAGHDSGAALFLKLLRLVVANRHTVSQTKKAAATAGGVIQRGPIVVESVTSTPSDGLELSPTAGGGTGGRPTATTVPSGLLSNTDLRKLGMLLDLAEGRFEILPEVIASTGLTIPPEKQANLVQIIMLIQSIKKIAQKKGDLSSLTAQDTIDIIASQMFNEFDIEGLGQISLDVFCMALARMQLNLSPQEQRLLFGKADKDGSGAISQAEFRGIIDEIQDRFRQRMIVLMGLSKETIYLTCVWISLFLIFIFLFIILGAIAFSNGTNFTAAITGLLPMAAGAVTSIKDPNALLRLLQVADEKVKAFFELLSEE